MRRFAILIPVLLAACQTAREEPDYVAVDHILIGVRSEKLPKAARNEDAARQLAYKLLDQLEHGGDWTALKKKYSDDPPPGGPYRLANHDVKPREEKEYPRKGMVRAFGDVSFSLDVGQVEIADYDKSISPFGFHIIRRIK